ncbi:hypothetical protein XELAEV_18005846mg [Xenopus laevis]|uniref:Uncharacterized protein n=1 Tax=Xenopus laevis TaxID=8355 RepID=A0A974E022_XENLA|nr:hypothetical protein XELAEV_18005846mg [Xenopus laevis]
MGKKFLPDSKNDNHTSLWMNDATALTCLSRKERFFLDQIFWLYRIIIKFLFFFFSLLVELAWVFIFVFFLTNSFLSFLPSLKGLFIVVHYASLVSLSDFGFLCRFSISLSESNSPL